MKKIILLSILGLMMTGCNNFDEDINVNPTKATKASGAQLLANAYRSLPDVQASASSQLYTQQWSEAEYITLSRYDNVFYNFYGWYSGPLINIETVLQAEELDANEGPVANQRAIAKILKSFFFWHMTDRWGDLPFTDALKGADNFTPEYDTQEAIYTGIFTLLDEANNEIVAGEIDNDYIYNDMQKWKKLGNTIHLLMALRLSKVDPDLAKTEFNKALVAGVMESNDDNLVYKYLSDANNWNYWYDVFDQQNRYWYAVSKPLVDYMKPVGDPRLSTFANTNKDGEYEGLEYGLTPDEVNVGPYAKPNISLLGDGMRQPSTPAYIVTYAQALFAQSEAAKLGWISGGDTDAEQFYNGAIEASVRQWNNNDISGLGTMMSMPEIIYNPATALEQIAYQRWVHNFMNGYEEWAEWRRTGYPALVAPSDNNGKEIPRREGYPTQEAQNNSKHYDEAVQRLGGTNDLNGRVWWDKE